MNRFLMLTLSISLAATAGLAQPFNVDLLPKTVTLGTIEYELNPAEFKIFASDAQESILLAKWPEGKTAAELAVLHTFEPNVGIEEWRQATGLACRQVQRLPEWPEVMRYEIEYADGENVVIPVRFGEAINDSDRVQEVGPMLWAHHNWTKKFDSVSDEKAAIYSMVFPNPRPAVPITALRALPASERYQQHGTAHIFRVQAIETAPQGRIIVVQPAPMGNDNQTGSFEKPFSSLQHALDIACPGDTILMRRGLYVTDRSIVLRMAGQKGKWLTVSAFPGESPIIDGYAVGYDLRQPAKDLVERDYIPEQTGRLQCDTGILHFFGDPSYLRVQGLSIQNSRRAAISVYGTPDPESTMPPYASWGVTDHVDVSFNSVYKSFTMGIITHQMDDLSVIGNRIVRPHAVEMGTNPFTGAAAAHDHQMQEAIDLSRNRRFEVGFNTVIGGGKEAIDCISVEDGSVHHNYVDSCLNGIYIDSWTTPILRLDIHHNFIHNAYNGIPLATEGGNDLMDFDIHHNIVIDSKAYGIGVTEATYKAKPARVQQHRVFNNTIYSGGGHALAIGWQAGGIEVGGFPDNMEFRDITVADNIVVDTLGMPLKNAYNLTAKEHNTQFLNNIVWPSENDTTPDWMRTPEKGYVATDCVKDPTTLVADPLFADPARGDFRLAEKSPARGAGHNGADSGALPYGAAWRPGLDFAGHVTAFYRGQTVWTPVRIDESKFTMHRNNLQRPSWFQRNRYGCDLRNLPYGEQSFAGVTFFIEEDGFNSNPTVMALSGIESESKAKSITDIVIRRKANKVAFLHNAHIADRRLLDEKAQLFHYRVHYVDGSAVDVPVRAGLETGDWLEDGIQTNPIENARVGWHQLVVQRKKYQQIHLYTLVWDNPKPDVELSSIDIVRDCEPLDATPAVFAVSTGL